VVERLDPLVTPGLNPSPHLHQIIGGVSPNTKGTYQKQGEKALN
jgi:hypothetical protein